MVVPIAASPTGETAENPTKKRGGGPQTAEGRRAASLNALKHGFRAKVALPEELAARVEHYRQALTLELMPRTEMEIWLVGQMGRSMGQLDRIWEVSLADHHRCVNIAQFDWVNHRRTLVENLGTKLASNPGRVVHALEQIEQGAIWMIYRWQGIVAVLETTGTCEEDLHSLIFDLKGVPAVLRAGNYTVPAATDIPGLLALAKEEIERLTELRHDELVDQEQFYRTMAVQGMPCHEDPETAKLRRYEAMCRRDLKWARLEFEKERGASLKSVDPSSPLLDQAAEPGLDYHTKRSLTELIALEDDASTPKSKSKSISNSKPKSLANANPTPKPTPAPVPPAPARPQALSPAPAPVATFPPPAAEAPRTLASRAAEPGPTAPPVARPIPAAVPSTPAPASASPRPPVPVAPRLASAAGRIAAPRNRRERRAAEIRARKAAAQRT